MARVLIVVAPDRFRDEELFDTRAALVDAGHTVTVASTRKGPCSGVLGGKVEAVTDVASQRMNDHEAVVFVGGPGARVLWYDLDALRLAREASSQGKVVAAICLAPVVLARAGLLAGRHVTCTPAARADLTASGGIYTGQGVCVDQRLVTASGPSLAHPFGQAIASLLTTP